MKMRRMMKRGRKGQLFTLDVLLAVAALAVVIGYASLQLEDVYLNANELQFQKMSSIANDWTQIGTKRLLAYVDVDGDKRPNIVDFDDVATWDTFVSEFTASLTSEYGAELSMSTNSNELNGGCTDKAFVAAGRRLVIDINTNIVDWLKVTVCFV